jgi:hypothetical protein
LKKIVARCQLPVTCEPARGPAKLIKRISIHSAMTTALETGNQQHRALIQESIFFNTCNIRRPRRVSPSNFKTKIQWNTS